jgi:hypothetical protein
MLKERLFGRPKSGFHEIDGEERREKAALGVTGCIWRIWEFACAQDGLPARRRNAESVERRWAEADGEPGGRMRTGVWLKMDGSQASEVLRWASRWPAR